MTIAEFLEARLDEDEAWAANPECDQDPARVLRDVEAKREIIALHRLQSLEVLPARHCERDGDLWPCQDLRLAAKVFANHPDYQEGWRS